MSRVLILASAAQANADRFTGAFGDLERSIQLAEVAGDPNYVRLLLIDPDESALDCAHRATGDFCEVERISSGNDLAEIQHHLGAFSPRAVVSVALGCAERLSHLPLDSLPAVWCDLAGSPCSDQEFDRSMSTKVLAMGDRFSAASALMRGVVLGGLAEGGLLGEETRSYQPVVSIPIDYQLLRVAMPKSARESIVLPAEVRSSACFKLLCLPLRIEDVQLLAQSVARANQTLTEKSEIKHSEIVSIFVDQAAMNAASEILSKESSVLIETASRRQMPALYDQCDLALVLGSEGWADAEAGARLRSELVTLGLPVLSAPVQDLSGAVALSGRCCVSELAEKLVWAVRHRARLRDLTTEEATTLAVQSERSSGRTLFEQWLSAPTRALAPPPTIAAADPAERGLSDELAPAVLDAPVPGTVTRVKRWLEYL